MFFHFLIQDIYLLMVIRNTLILFYLIHISEMNKNIDLTNIILNLKIEWRAPSLSELTPMIFNTVLTHLGSEAFNYSHILKC